MYASGIPNLDCVAGTNNAANHYDAHDARPADLLAWPSISFAVDKHHLQYARSDIGDLFARVTEPGEGHESVVADSQHGAHR